MHKNLIEIANETIQILESGLYNVRKAIFNIKNDVEKCVEGTKVYMESEYIPGTILSNPNQGMVSVVADTTLHAAKMIDDRVVILNFASAKNPGGGFLSGSVAQEESIAYSSCLYQSLISVGQVYDYNRKHLNYGLYNDNIIYSPDMVVFRDDKYQLVEPWFCSCISSAAVNRRATNRCPDITEATIDKAMIQRIEKTIKIAALENHTNIVLGAFGCGVFKNNAEKVAEYFHTVLFGKENYATLFDQIIFAIKPTGNDYNYKAFKSVFAD